MRSRFDADAEKDYVVEQYDHGLLVKTEHFRDGKPID